MMRPGWPERRPKFDIDGGATCPRHLVLAQRRQHAKTAASGKKLKLSNRDEETLRIAHAWADRGFFSKREVDEAFAMYFETPVLGAAPGEEVKGAPGTTVPLSGKQVDEIMDASPFLKTFVEAKVQGGLKAEGHVHILDAPAYAATYVRIMTAIYESARSGKPVELRT